MIWITSDHHFSHQNILKYCNRDFESIEDHDDALIDIWNKFVKPDDLVYHLGDFTLGNRLSAEVIFRRINGYIRILENPWHHDKRWLGGQLYMSASVHDIVYDRPIVVLEHEASVPIVMCHYAFEEWDRKHYGAVHFHGHSHGNLPKVKGRLDVGVDNAYKLLGDYRPFLLDEAIDYANVL